MKNFTTMILTKLKHLFGLYKSREISPDKSTTSVVIAGVEQSPKWGSCPGAMADCTNFSKVISDAANNYDLTVLRNEQATVANWKNAVAKAVQKPLAIIYYSGHGGSDPGHVLGKGKNEEDGIDEFLCLYDKHLLDDEIWNLISKSTGRVFLIFDCCHSATMFREDGNSILNKLGKFIHFNFGKYDKTPKDANQTGPSILCWSACADNTVAQGANSGGIFTTQIKRFFGIGLTYDALWKKLKDCKYLQNIEQIQITEIGKSFKSNLFCR